MNKKTIIILTCVWGRPEITKMYIKGVKLLRDKLKNLYNFKTVIVDSEFSNYDLFNGDDTFMYFNHPNNPVSNKWNFGLSQCRDLEYDYVLMMGSDDIICDSVLSQYNNYFNLGYDYIGLTDLYVYNTLDSKFYYWSGYSKSSGRYGESLGLGRCIHKNIIETFNYKLWIDGLNKGLDGSMEKKLKGLPGIKKINFNSSDYGVSCDIKSTINITKLDTFINQLTEINFFEYKYKFVRDCVINNQLSIIIPTYKNTQYLIDCLDSIINSVKDLDCEILVGIDGCELTKEFISNKMFDSRINFYFFEKNVGPYIVKNSLCQISNSDYILFFDSDDIMKPELIEDIVTYKNTFDLIKPMYLDFQKDVKFIDDKILLSKTYGEGVFGIKKELFLKFNGFEGWRCAADSDLMGRLYKNKVKLTHTKRIGFYRRIHSDSLTQRPETNFFSTLRTKYASISKNKKYHGPLEKLIVEPFNLINNLSSEYESNDVFVSKEEKIKTIKDGLNFNTKKETNKLDYNKININSKSYNPSKHIKPVRENIPINRNELFEIKKGTLAEQNREFFPMKRKLDL